MKWAHLVDNVSGTAKYEAVVVRLVSRLEKPPDVSV